MVELHVPNKSYEGYFGGVRFHRGVGVFTDVEAARKLAKQFDFTIVETEKVAAVEEVAKVKPAAKKRATKAKATPKDGE